MELNTIEIWSPKYQGKFTPNAEWEVWPDMDKVTDHNKIIFTHAKHLEGKQYYLSGKVARQCPQTSFKAKSGKDKWVYAVPFSDLELLATPEGKI